MCVDKNNKERGDIMPPVAMIEYDKELYCSEMEEYFQKLKTIPKEKIKEIARKNLVQAGIVDKNGNLTDHYSNSRQDGLYLLYSKLPNLVIGFHGCDRKAYKNALYKHQHIFRSEHTYDWLGHGIYFWEHSYERAVCWAKDNKEDPAVIGAVIDLGNCLNLTDYKSASILKNGYDILKYECEHSDSTLPINRDKKGTTGKIIRDLDCAVFQRIHSYNEHEKKKPFDSVRGVFFEGDSIYPGTELKEKTHIQLCITNPNCIKGYFRPQEIDEKFIMP